MTGLIPTFGRVPTSGCVPLGYSLDHIGPLVRRSSGIPSLARSFSASPPKRSSTPSPDIYNGLQTQNTSPRPRTRS
nr:amidase family protein [Streptomonospora salina]